jgi:hypothetical protein
MRKRNQPEQKEWTDPLRHGEIGSEEGDRREMAKGDTQTQTQVRKHRLARRQARQAKGKRENRYVFKVMSLNMEGSQSVPESLCIAY